MSSDFCYTVNPQALVLGFPLLCSVLSCIFPEKGAPYGLRTTIAPGSLSVPVLTIGLYNRQLSGTDRKMSREY